jgi:hypothetical protein
MLTVYEDRAAWSKARAEARAIGASDVPVLIEGSHFGRSEWDIFAALTAEEPPPPIPESEAMRIGTMVEPIVARWACERLGVPYDPRPCAVQVGPLRVSPDVLHIGADGQPVLVEVKTTAPYRMGEWAADGTIMAGGLEDEGQTYPCPAGYLWQLLAQAAAIYSETGTMPRCYFAVAAVERAVMGLQVEGLDFPVSLTALRLIEVEPDPDDLERLLSVVTRWHLRHVVHRLPPTIDASGACRSWLLRSRLPRTEVIDAGTELDSLLTAAFEARAAASAAESAQKLAEAEVLARIEHTTKTVRATAGKVTISATGRATWTAAKGV